MTDKPIVHIGENSPEEVALKLLRVIAEVERKSLHANPSNGYQTVDRNWLLSTYSECLSAVRGYRDA